MHGRTGQARRIERRRWSGAVMAGAAIVPFVVVGCGHSKKAAAPPPSTAATTTTTLAVSHLEVVGVRPGVNQAPFYPMATVTSVTCGTGPKGRFVRIDVPAGLAGTTARSAMTELTAVIVVPRGAVLVDQTAKVLYSEVSSSIKPSTGGPLVLALQSITSRGGHGLVVQSGVVQVNGDYACPTADVAYPGT